MTEGIFESMFGFKLGNGITTMMFPELSQGQSAERPDWQKGLPLDTLLEIDRLANAVLSSGWDQTKLDAYEAFTNFYRSRSAQ